MPLSKTGSPQRENFTLVPNIIFDIEFKSLSTFVVYVHLRRLAPPDEPKGRTASQVISSLERLVKLTKLGKSTIRDAKQELIGLGLIQIATQGSSHQPTTFSIVNLGEI